MANKLAARRAGTNSFSNLSLQERIATTEAATNSFSTHSFLDRILSLRKWLQIFLLSSFQLTCAALLLGTYSLSMSFPNESLQSDELVAAYCRDSFQPPCLQQDELATAYAYSPTRARQLQHDSLQQKELCRSSLETLREQLGRIKLDSLIIQLDLVTSLSLTRFGSTRCRHQLQSNSFDKSSFEHRALPCAALLAATLVAFSLGAYQHKSFQLPMQQLYLSWTQGGAYPHGTSPRALSTAWLTTTLILTSLSFAIDAWLKTSTNRAWRRRSLRNSFCRRSLSTRSSPTTFTTRSTKAATRSLRGTLLSIAWFSFLINNILIDSSFWEQEKKQNNTASHQLCHQHFHSQQLCLQDPASTISRQLPEESLSSTCLSDSSLDPAASLSDTLSFSKQKLSAQDLSNNSFDKNKQLAERNLFQVQLVYYQFFPENFGQQLSETDQHQLQESNLTQTTFQQLSLDQPSYKEKILHNELATTCDKKSLEGEPSFQNFSFDNLAFQTTTSGELAEKNFYKQQLAHSSFTRIAEGACKEQLPATGFPAASANKQLSNSNLLQQWPKQLHTQNFHQLTLKEPLDRKNFFTESFQKNILQTELLPEHLCRDQLAEKNFCNNSFYTSSFPEETFNQTAFQPAVCQKRASEQQLLRQQL